MSPIVIVDSSSSSDCQAVASRKRVAGQDPVKREQILDGAYRCFMKLGFQAASMNEITAEAGVSKGTIYVYFDNKEELFGALIERERTKQLSMAAHQLDENRPMREALCGFGISIASTMNAEDTLRAQRMVLAVVESMPSIARRFFQSDPASAVTVLRSYFEKRVASGELKIDDYELAAKQLLELSMAGIYKMRLFGNRSEPFTREQIVAVASRGVDMFLHYYGTEKGR